MLPKSKIDINNLEEIHTRIKACNKCGLCNSCTNHVPGEGNPNADVVFIGEAPGRNEDLKGKPFCGRAGQVLDELLKLADYKREDIYITNILKCRPPKNRNPKPKEIELCTPHLIQQIKIIKPRVICCLGNFAVSFIMKKFSLAAKVKPIGKIHGKIFIPPKISSLKIIPFYHPASATYNPGMIDVLKKDFQLLKNIPI
ncbi:MAG: uracil-DNA glycosylase [Candidatus Omnitrophica bacterium]|nr:uracil-DNA glycosylase [Candidatus Omnitrophota bacterium]